MRLAGNDVGAVQVAPFGKQAGVADGKVGGHDHLARPERAAPGLDDAGCAIADSGDTRVLKHVASAPVHGAGEALKVSNSVKLCLVVEPDRAPDGERQRHVGGEG